MTDAMETKALECLMKALREDDYLTECSDGTFCETISAHYDDALPDELIEKILLSMHPEEHLMYAVEDYYDGFTYSRRDNIAARAVKYLMHELKKTGCQEKDNEEAIWDYVYDKLCDRLYFEFPYDHFYKQECCVDLMIDTGDANFDYGCNSPYPYWCGEKGVPLEKESALVWLAETQGYTKKQLEQALDEGDVEIAYGFLESMRQEVANETSSMNCLTFLVRMRLDDLARLSSLIKLQEPEGEHFFNADLRPDCGSLKISKKAQPGLYDPWNGAGSVFDIKLEKDITLPVKYIRSCLPDSHFRWSVESVYGMLKSAWEDVVTDIKGPEV